MQPNTPRGLAGDAKPTNAGELEESLERRRRAAAGLENDLLSEVPLLYGSAEGQYGTGGDPGIVLAQIHRENVLRRNGYDPAGASGARSEVTLPFERATGALAVILLLIFLFWK